jgi:hypothetical protein
MKAKCQHFYFYSLLSFAMLLMLLTLPCFPISKTTTRIVTVFRKNETKIKTKIKTREEQVSYPWIKDSSCQHLGVRVKLK